jgi:hypothetical protein
MWFADTARGGGAYLVPVFDALARTTALIQFARDVRGDFVLIDFGLGLDKANPLVDTSVTIATLHPSRLAPS